IKKVYPDWDTVKKQEELLNRAKTANNFPNLIIKKPWKEEDPVASNQTYSFLPLALRENNGFVEFVYSLPQPDVRYGLVFFKEDHLDSAFTKVVLLEEGKGTLEISLDKLFDKVVK
ncbi:hypothetical protein KKE06_00370, partial [Candidatus Micrarchaeota archaeon]|nr:hypothetical protein [Candidatus Micrarchaeota archaeon]MBU1930466.1 hypothetical protein [Candidatus Micrarchaeota archaeon]